MTKKDLELLFKINGYQKVISLKTFESSRYSSLYYDYILHHQTLHLKTDSSLYTEVKMIAYFFNFIGYKKIDNLQLFDYRMMQEFFSYLKITPTKTGKRLSQSSQRLVYTFFKSFSKWLYQHHKDKAPALSIFQKSPYRRNNETLKGGYFSDDVLKQIKHALIIEEDIYTKTYIMILLHYGLRSIDIVSLTNGCLKPSNKSGKYDLYYKDYKQNKFVTIPSILTPVSSAIQTLIHKSKLLEHESDFIFIKKGYRESKVKPFKSYQKNLFDRFVKEHHIVDRENNPIKITAHMFRRTLATNLQSSGASLESIQSVLNHSSKRSTILYYIKTKEHEYIKQISELLNEMQIIASQAPTHIENIIESHDTIRLADGYCTNQEMQRDESYICNHFIKRGNCYGCNKMVTTPNFLPYFRVLLKEKELEINHAYTYGEHLLQNISFEKDMIEALIERLEELK